MNKPRTIELIGRYEGERFRFNNPEGSVVIGSIKLANASKELASEYGVRDVHGPLAIKGEDDHSLECNKTYRFLGSFADYHNKRTGVREKQFGFRTFVEHIPHDSEGLAKYLVDCGRGIGPAKAKILVSAFGVDDVLEICRTDPKKVSLVAKIDEQLAFQFAEKLNSLKATENAKLEIDKLLHGKGFPKSLGNRLVKEWGNLAATILVESPYLLMKFKGVGFRLADKLYLELGKDPASDERQALSLWYSMASDQSGSSWFPAEDQIQFLKKMIGAGSDYRKAITKGKELGAVATIRSDGKNGAISENGSFLWLGEGKVASQEAELARLVARAVNSQKSIRLTLFDAKEETLSIPAEFMRCARCSRALTAEEVVVANGLPYGPVCAEREGFI